MMVRVYQTEDEAAVIELWERCGLTRPWNDPKKDIARKVAHSAKQFLVQTDDSGRVIATAMYGYDGHRGSVFYLAVEPSLQGQGVGRLLMEYIEAALLEQGCPKLNLMVRDDNEPVLGFYTALDYGTDAVAIRSKRLIADQ